MTHNFPGSHRDGARSFRDSCQPETFDEPATRLVGHVGIPEKAASSSGNICGRYKIESGRQRD
jgi:hypothetical protein